MGENEVVKKDDDVELAQPSAEFDILDYDVEESPAKRRRRLMTPLTSEDVV